jgi:TetR/AcrR family transcriptional repressor of bet genes
MSDGDDGNAPDAPKTSRAAAKAERRLHLIDATITSIATYGLTGTTLARVTEIAGTSVGLANFHFESKERLFEAVLAHLAEEQRTLWQNRNLDASLSSADRLMAIIDSRFHSRICDRRKLAIWFAVWGDASARDTYRQIVGELDDELLAATVAILKLMIVEGGYAGLDPMETALALEAMYDGFWLNMLLYPDEFKRLDCRARTLSFVAAILPRHFQNRADRV